jgi:hypothetical protein
MPADGRWDLTRRLKGSNIRTSRLRVSVESVRLSGSMRSSQQDNVFNLFFHVASPSIALITQHEITGLRVNCKGRGRKTAMALLEVRACND